MCFSGWNTFKPFDVQGFVTSCFGVVFAGFMFIFWKVFKKTKFVNPAKVDLYAGKAEIDLECRHWDDDPKKEKTEMTKMERLWDACW